MLHPFYGKLQEATLQMPNYGICQAGLGRTISEVAAQLLKQGQVGWV